jgi:hypothetical protein
VEGLPLNAASEVFRFQLLVVHFMAGGELQSVRGYKQAEPESKEKRMARVRQERERQARKSAKLLGLDSQEEEEEEDEGKLLVLDSQEEEDEGKLLVLDSQEEEGKLLGLDSKEARVRKQKRGFSSRSPSPSPSRASSHFSSRPTARSLFH